MFFFLFVFPPSIWSRTRWLQPTATHRLQAWRSITRWSPVRPDLLAGWPAFRSRYPPSRPSAQTQHRRPSTPRRSHPRLPLWSNRRWVFGRLSIFLSSLPLEGHSYLGFLWRFGMIFEHFQGYRWGKLIGDGKAINIVRNSFFCCFFF